MTARAQREGGFLLVGVIIFVLALTILGMSLYSLSGYESDFQANALDSGASFYAAQGGLVMVQALLAQSPYKLSAAKTAVGYRGITYVNATQRRSTTTLDSVGAINWDSTLTVTVRAQVRGGVHLLTARYTPTPRFEPYKRLFTVSGLDSGDVDVPVNFDGFNRLRTFRVTDPSSDVWLNTAVQIDILALEQNLNWGSNSAFKFGGIPHPDAQGFYLQNPGPFTSPAFNGSHTMTLGTAAGTPTYYMSTAAGDYSFDAPSGGTITMSGNGTAVWMCPHGFRASNQISIVRAAAGGAAGPFGATDAGPGEGSEQSRPTLVLVGSPNWSRTDSTDRPIGLYFRGGLDVATGINVILVSDGTLELAQQQSFDKNLQAERLSVYCRRLTLIGPVNDFHGYVSDLDHNSGMDAVIDTLVSQGALPRCVGALPTMFSLVKGSWRDLTP